MSSMAAGCVDTRALGAHSAGFGGEGHPGGEAQYAVRMKAEHVIARRVQIRCLVKVHRKVCRKVPPHAPPAA